MKYIDLVEKVLRENDEPMCINDIWEYAEKNGYTTKLNSVGQTPKKTINVLIHYNMKRKNPTIEQVSWAPSYFRLKNN